MLIHESQVRIEQVISALREELGPATPPATERSVRHAIALLHGVLDTLVPLRSLLGATTSGARHATAPSRQSSANQQQRQADSPDTPAVADKGS